MDRRRDPRYKQHEAHHYDERYNATYDNYDYEEDYGNQYANTVPHHHHPHPHPHAHPHHPEDHGYDDEEDHWANQQGQQDFYDTVPATNIPPAKLAPKNVARVQISTSIPSMEAENPNIPQAPPPPRFGPTGGYSNNNNNNNDRKVSSSKYGNMATTEQKQRRDRESDVHIRFDPGAKRDFPQKQASFIDGFRSNDNAGNAKKKETSGQTTNTIRSIINNLKGGGEKQEDTTPRNRVSTNPFMRANQQMSQNQNQANRYEPKNPSKNVAEVVEKMNNGDWPIQIDDEEAPPVPATQDPKRAYQQDKARQWETLHRKKDEKRSILEDALVGAIPPTPPAPPLPTQQPPPSSQKHQHPQMQKQASRDENDKMSEQEEHTSVSTDSALCSESSDIGRGPSPYKLPFENQKPSELSEEAEKLLFYFKSHKDVLNYLGIGLTERLWKHIQKLPNFEASIRVFKKHEELSSKPPPAPPLNASAAPAPIQSASIPPAPKITLSQSFAQQDRDRKSPIGHAHTRSVSQNEELPPQSLAPEESRFTKNPDGLGQGNRERANCGGRFVKKSAAALIAKKQGMQTEDPNSATDIIDPRIAEEIKNLRDREEELKRSRSELALVTSPLPSSYQMSPKKSSPGNNSMMRNAQSFDHLDNPMGIRSPIERSHSSHNVYHLKSAMQGDSSPYHHGNAFANTNYGSMPRAQNRKEGSFHPQMRDHRMHDGGYRQSRNPDFFRQAPTASEATNAGWQKSPSSFEAKPSVAIHSGLQLPAAGLSISSYQQRSNDKYQNPKSMYGAKQHDAHRKIGL